MALVVRSDGRICGRTARTVALVREVFRKSVRDNVMLSFALLCDHCLDRASKADLVPKGTGSDEVEEKIGTRHRVLSMSDLLADDRAKGAQTPRPSD